MIWKRKDVSFLFGWLKDEEKKSVDSPTGNRTRVFRVTGGDTYHYTIEDYLFASSKLKTFVLPYHSLILFLSPSLNTFWSESSLLLLFHEEL